MQDPVGKLLLLTVIVVFYHIGKILYNTEIKSFVDNIGLQQETTR